VAVLIPFSYVVKFFHDFRIFILTLVNILKNITDFDHYFLICEGRQRDTNMNLRYVMNLHEVYTGEYFQIFSS
jgi:hypothetical protein